MPSLARSLTAVLLGVMLGANGPNANADGSTSETVHAPHGEYVLRASGRVHDNVDFKKFCAAYTANLNEFRHLDFDTCDPRLSPRYPRFSRPQWEEIPLDLAIARKILTDRPSVGFDRWLRITETARATGEVRLWRIRVDFLKDGHLDTLVRLDHASDGTRPHCSYVDSKQMIVDIPEPRAAKWYAHAHLNNTDRLGGDMIYDADTKRYYVEDWNRYTGAGGRGLELGGNIGATASVMVYGADYDGVQPVCAIEWVPTGQHKK